MSQRSIIEVNHDIAGSAKDHGIHFMTLWGWAIASGSDQAWEGLKAYGIRRITQCHHSEDRKVIVGNGALEREYDFS